MDRSSDKDTASFTFSNKLPPYLKEDHSCDKETASFNFSNRLPPDYALDNSDDKEKASFAFSNRIPSDSKKDETPTSAAAEKRHARRILISHGISLILAIPSLVLFAIDLHNYLTETATRPSAPQAGQYSNINPILILDGVNLTLLAVTVLYAAFYFSSRHLFELGAIQAHIIPIFILDGLLCAGIQAVSDTSLAMRSTTELNACHRFLYLDPHACDSSRRTIIRAAGVIGAIASGAIHIRWSTSMTVWWYRGQGQKSS